jgi:hypothetical protein
VASKLPPIGFWSYARQDDEASRGRLSSLRSLLMSELQQQYGRQPVKVFQDVAAIAPGAEWKSEITNALNRSNFFIPIITPASLESEHCCAEIRLFLERERAIVAAYPALAGRRRIFPLHYMPIDDVDPFDPDILVELRRLQWLKFLDLRFKADHEEPVRVALAGLAGGICRLLNMKTDSPAPPSPPLNYIPPPPPPPPRVVPSGLVRSGNYRTRVGLGSAAALLLVLLAIWLSSGGGPDTVDVASMPELNTTVDGSDDQTNLAATDDGQSEPGDTLTSVVELADDSASKAEASAREARLAAAEGDLARKRATAGEAGYGATTGKSDDGKFTSRYWGALKSGTAEGYGVRLWSDGELVRGQFANGSIDGYAVTRLADANIYEGQFRAGKMEGYGIYLFKSGNRRVGKWVNDESQGWSVAHYTDRFVYKGYYRNGKRDGPGILYDAAGRVSESGIYSKGELQRSIAVPQ